MDEEVTFVFMVLTAAIIAAVVMRICAGSMDRKRIEAYLNSRNSQMLELEWTLFGPGWFGSRWTRTYRVVYKSSDGKVYRAYVKTAMHNGVYMTEDRVVDDADAARYEVRPEHRDRQ